LEKVKSLVRLFYLFYLIDLISLLKVFQEPKKAHAVLLMRAQCLEAPNPTTVGRGSQRNFVVVETAVLSSAMGIQVRG
jgi:hypothetical protein